MCFALVCTIGMLKFTGQSDRSKNKHMFTQSLYIHMNASYWQWWSDFIKPRYLHLAIFFTTVNIWVRESTITFKYAQQATTTAHTFISSCCFVIFFIFLNFWEQIWAELGSFLALWSTMQNTDQLWTKWLWEGKIISTAGYHNQVTSSFFVFLSLSSWHVRNKWRQ